MHQSCQSIQKLLKGMRELKITEIRETENINFIEIWFLYG